MWTGKLYNFMSTIVYSKEQIRWVMTDYPMSKQLLQRSVTYWISNVIAYMWYHWQITWCPLPKNKIRVEVKRGDLTKKTLLTILRCNVHGPWSRNFKASWTTPKMTWQFFVAQRHRWHKCYGLILSSSWTMYIGMIATVFRPPNCYDAIRDCEGQWGNIDTVDW